MASPLFLLSSSFLLFLHLLYTLFTSSTLSHLSHPTPTPHPFLIHNHAVALFHPAQGLGFDPPREGGLHQRRLLHPHPHLAQPSLLQQLGHHHHHPQRHCKETSRLIFICHLSNQLTSSTVVMAIDKQNKIGPSSWRFAQLRPIPGGVHRSSREQGVAFVCVRKKKLVYVVCVCVHTRYCCANAVIEWHMPSHKKEKKRDLTTFPASALFWAIYLSFRSHSYNFLPNTNDDN